MSDANEKFESDKYWLKYLVEDNVKLIGWLAMIAFVGHKSFGLPDYGVTPLHLFLIGLGGAFAIGCGVAIINHRLSGRMKAEFKDCGFTQDEIDDLKIF